MTPSSDDHSQELVEAAKSGSMPAVDELLVRHLPG
jgi:hypothetical protein